MNRVTMVIWGLIIFGMWGIFLTLAYLNQDKEYINLTADLKSVTKRYINKKNIDLKYSESYKVYIKDLEDADLIINKKKIDDYCVDSIVITKNLFNYSYVINAECENKE